MSESPVFDRGAAMDRVDEDQELYYELFDMLFEEYENGKASLLEAVKSGDSSRLEAAAHSFKSAFGNLGAMKVYDASYALEKAGKRGELSGAQALLDTFLAAVEEFRSLIASERSKESL